jgi:DNA phosphorothioation-associated putative methyltransferase
MMSLTGVNEAIANATVGKTLPTAFYVHSSGLWLLPQALQHYERCARYYLNFDEHDYTLVKFGRKRPYVSYLTYPQFDTDPHPRLRKAVRVNLGYEQGRSVRKYNWRKNPPILHRKELFVPEGYPGRDMFAALSKAEEEAGLLGSGKIGLRKMWTELLKTRGLRIQDHSLVSAT